MQQRIPVRIALNLRRLRADRGVSLSELARSSGVSKGTLSRLESGSGNPTVETLMNLARSLGVSLDDLLADEGSRVRVVRSTEGTWVRGSAVGYRLMDRLLGRSVVDVYENVYVAGMRRESEGHAEGSIEHLFVIAGRLMAGPVGEAVEVETGDYARYPADRPHVYEAIGEEARAVLLISYMQMPSSSQELQRELEHMLSTGDKHKQER
jgi:transcriptional regulator with XRE-family HTH domain